MDVISLIVGGVVTFVAMWIVMIVLTPQPKKIEIVDPTIDPEYKKLQDKPHCPYCQSCDLILIDDNDAVPWLKNHIPDLDHYRCKKCGESFSDEDWKDVKTYG